MSECFNAQEKKMFILRLIRKNRDSLVLVSLFFISFFYYLHFRYNVFGDNSGEYLSAETWKDTESEVMEHRDIVKRFYEKRKNWKTSNLGSILFKNATYEDFKQNSLKNKTYTILFWKFWDWLKKRHVYNFDATVKKDLLELRSLIRLPSVEIMANPPSDKGGQCAISSPSAKREDYDKLFMEEAYVQQWTSSAEMMVTYISLDKDNRSEEILKYCHVKNCIFHGNNKYLNSVDAIVIHMQRQIFPIVKDRNPNQRWIFLSDESPMNTFSLAKPEDSKSLSEMSGIFNWTMTFRSDADIPVPYGRTVPLQHSVPVNMSDVSSALKKLVPYWQEKKPENLIMILASNCMKARMQFIYGLKNFLEVDVFGSCADVQENKLKCPGHFKTDCLLPSSYLFYLVMENSECHQYITEKAYQHAYSKGAIPVILGPSLKDCEELLPPNSFIHVKNYKNIEQLSEYLIDISKDDAKILSFHAWRRHFVVLNEHGYFKTKSYHLCRICEAMNYNDVGVKIYNEDELNEFFDKNKLCDVDYETKHILY